ncbi:MAG: CopG family ribbon-helix-helix protein [Moorellales bacterium]
MPGVRRIMISLPQSLLEEVDGLAAVERRNRSEFIREAMRVYIAERKRRTVREEMKRGYQEMAALNLALAQEHFALEEEAQGRYEADFASL